MTADELRRELASGDEHAGRRAIRACGELLREGRVENARALVAVLAPLAQHASAVVRQATADVCDAFDDAEYDAAHALLLTDRDAYVRRAAEAAGHRRAKQRRQRAKEVAADRGHDADLAEIERRFGKPARKLAERAVESGVERFAQLLDHETRKTKNAIRATLMLASAELDRPERSIGLLKEQLATLRERSTFVFEIVRRARDYASRVKPSFAEASLAALVDEARAQLLARLGPRASTVAFTNDVAPELCAEVDRHAILQALQNLLQNAAEAYDERAPERAVRVSGRLLPGATEVELRVADDGVGITPEILARLDVPFGSRKPGGTGVGMLIVRRMVKQVHGGTVSIATKEGEGTTITMVLPVKQRA